MKKYVFEKYEINEKGRIFLGYLTVNGKDNSYALNNAREKVGENIILHEIYTPQS